MSHAGKVEASARGERTSTCGLLDVCMLGTFRDIRRSLNSIEYRFVFLKLYVAGYILYIIH